MQKRVRAAFFACVIFASLSAPAHAVVLVDGDAAFSAAVKRCFDEFREAGGDAAALLKRLQAPGPAKRNTIHNTPVNPATGAPAIHSNATHYDPATGQPGAGGTPGTGSDTTIDWNPADNTPFPAPNSEPRDPCVSLLHEMSHADEANQGTLDTGPYVDPDGHWGINITQVHAIDTENKHRKTKGLPQRKHDGIQAVPPRATH